MWLMWSMSKSGLDINMIINLLLFFRVYSINLRRLSIRGILDGKCKKKRQ